MKSIKSIFSLKQKETLIFSLKKKKNKKKHEIFFKGHGIFTVKFFEPDTTTTKKKIGFLAKCMYVHKFKTS